MDFSKFWWTSPEDGPLPPIDSIPNSLRLRGAQYLSRESAVDGNRTTWTWSGWVKKTFLAKDSLFLFNIRKDGNADGFRTSGSDQFEFSSSVAAASSNAEYRDPNAWYHIVQVFDSTQATETERVRLYVNGVRSPYKSQSGPSQNQTGTAGGTGIYAIGGSSATFPASSWEGYIAEVYFIDGQALEPTAFGRYDAEGIWVPRDVDFTPAVPKFSNFLTSPKGTWSIPPVNTFNGNLIDGAVAGGYDGSTGLPWTQTFAPDPPIPVTSSVEVYTTTVEQVVNFNGSDTNITPNTWMNLWNGSTEISKDNPIVMKSTANADVMINAIRVDGQILMDPNVWSSQVTLVGQGSENGFDDDKTPINMFDGKTNTYCIGTQSNQSIKWVPDEPIHYKDSVAIWTPSAENANTLYLYYEGEEVAVVGCLENQWTYLVQGESGVFDDLRIYGAGTDARVAAVLIDNVVWTDGQVPGGYGNNGFHLTFEDPHDVGKDYSGNENNFTATGFDLNPPKIPQWQTYAEDWGTPYTNDPAAIFSGAATGDFESWDWYFLMPSACDITGILLEAGVEAGDVIKFTLYPRTGSITCDISGTSGVATGNTGVPQDVSVTVPAGGVTSCTITGTDPTYWGIGAIYVNDVMLVNNGSGYSYDLVLDSPTQNYATLNALIPSIAPQFNGNGEYNYSNGNLGSTTPSGYASNFAGIRPQDNIYWEIKYDQTPTSVTYSGLSYYDTNRGNVTDAWWGYYTSQGHSSKFVQNGVEISGNENTLLFTSGDVAGYWLNDGNLYIYKNGLQTGSVNLADADPNKPLFINHRPNGTEQFYINFGQLPYYFAPEGTLDLQTQILPSPTIKDGRDHFQAITTGPGLGQTYAQGQIDITSPFVADPAEEKTWRDPSLVNYVGVITLDAGAIYNPLSVWSAAGNSGLQIFISEDGQTWTNTGETTQGSGSPSVQTFTGPARYVRFGNGGGTWQGDYFTGVGTLDILGLAQDTFPNGLWWVKSRTSGNHQLVDSARGGNFVLHSNDAASETSYSDPGTDAVAWCWKAGDTKVTDNTGSIESQVTVNHDAGFSIVEWVGNGNFDSIGHGLGKRPAMVITRSRQGDHWIVGHDSITTLTSGGSPNQWVNTDSFVGSNWSNALLLNKSNDASDYVAASGINVSGKNMLAYVWTPIEGYSEFGKYEGNGAGDGPMIQLPFKPAFVMIKCSSSGTDGVANWFMQDTTREPYNPLVNPLAANTDLAEYGFSAAKLDIVSNGFKLRGGPDQMNGAKTYIYAAFAENPFGGLNVSPVTAR